MDFDFRSFSTRSFERFAQSLATHTLGTGILIFGDGPDGGREASYEGILDYPSHADGWNGYTVMQAKFRQIPGTPAQDANWLIDQMRAEFDKFISPRSVLKKPDYYIIVTNARLSSVPATKRSKGGIDKIGELFAKYGPKLGLKGYRIWHLDQISAMLMDAPELRRSYAAWLCSSDVIADIIDERGRDAKAVRDTMYRYLCRELRDHRPLRLQQAGHGSDAQTMIEDVITDLPFTQRGEESPDDLMLLDSLLGCSRDCLDRASVKQQPREQQGRPERILLLGGPGQGKSTISQFLAQIFRANMLNIDRAGEISAETSVIVEATLKAALSENILTQVPKRFPIRVDLPMFADALASTKSSLSLLGYIASQISRIGDAVMAVDSLRIWLKENPSILILDGLDEVPPSANRAEVVHAISNFWDEASSCDVLMLVTTRPQGYNDDLDPELYTQLEMTPLPANLAVAYAQKLATNRIIDPVQRERTLSRVTAASRSPITARLMVSPLQVAILLALIDQRGDAPNDRWSLFEKFFNVVLEREQAKPGPIGETMRRWHRPISGLHHRAGFLLHVDAETQGHSESYLTSEELAELIRGQLADVGHEGRELEEITAELLSASTERLVLLAQRQEGRFSFEVRSLQEFMAAAYIMSGRDVRVQDRLRLVANREHWLHVFQIAASKCFAAPDTEHHRDTIITICRELNENDDAIDKMLRTGSQLALSLLDDGLAFGQPKYHRMLVSLALDIVYAGPKVPAPSLREHLSEEPARAIEQLRPRLMSPFSETRLAAWTILLQASSRRFEWADQLIDELWPTDSERLLELFSCQFLIPENSLLERRMRDALETVSPFSVVRTLGLLRSSDRLPHAQSIVKVFTCLDIFSRESGEEGSAQVHLGGHSTPLSLCYPKLKLSERRRAAFRDLPASASWAPMRALRDFEFDPRASTLADILDLIVAHGWQADFEMISSIASWPLSTAIYLGYLGEDLPRLSACIRSGGWGDISEWRDAESRWEVQGVLDADLVHCGSCGLIDAEIAKVGVGHGALSLVHGGHDVAWVGRLLGIGMASQGASRALMRRMVAFTLSLYSFEELTLSQSIFLIESGVGPRGKELLEIYILNSIPDEVVSSQEVLGKISTWASNGKKIYKGHQEIRFEIFKIFNDNLDVYPGLIASLAVMIIFERSGSFFSTIDKCKLEYFKVLCGQKFEKYAILLLILQNIWSGDDLECIIEDNDPFFVSLLDQIISHSEIDTKLGLDLAGKIAELANAKPRLNVTRLHHSIQSLARQRRADLHIAERWQQLELGATLLKQASRRLDR